MNFQNNSLHYLLTVMPPKLLPIYNKVLINFLGCIRIVPCILSNICHITDMYQILAEGVIHYTVVYGLNAIKLKDKVAGHQSAYWNTMKDCFCDICTFSGGQERAKGYSRADFYVSGPPAIYKVKSTEELGLCFKCSGPHFQNSCRKNKGHLKKSFRITRKFTILTSFIKIIILVVIFLQVLYPLQQIKPDDTPFSVITIKHFPSRIGEKYTLQKKSNTPSDALNSQDVMLNEISTDIAIVINELLQEELG